ncbi:hypothetical protein HMPREF1144_0568 [Klebsiella sp. OBRC7]|nr:hypothetical protein HMPREF1144_0568 [Klebsiella sp. OBRC7]
MPHIAQKYALWLLRIRSKKAHKRYNHAPLWHGLINQYGKNEQGLCYWHR